MAKLDIGWNGAPQDITLSPDEVHFWRAPLDLPAAELEKLADSLFTEERERAGRYVLSRDGARFMAGRGFVRAVLGRYLGLPPSQVVFRSGPAGKPELADPPAHLPIRFNLSHSGPLALLGVTLGRHIGVDVEQVRPMPDALALAERFFCPNERRILRGLTGSEQLQAFFRCWTRKEAYMKARGLGLSLGLDRFEVAFAPGESPRLLKMEGEPEEVRRWWFTDIPLGSGFIAAGAIEGGPCGVRMWKTDE